MGRTPVNLYRWGKTPRMERVRTILAPNSKSIDAVAFTVVNENGLIEPWVKGRVSGVSCFIRANNIFRGGGKWWVLPSNTHYDDSMLYLYSPDKAHWYWAPDGDMTLEQYQRALAAMNKDFQ
jgi:hypothetical protein